MIAHQAVQEGSPVMPEATLVIARVLGGYMLIMGVGIIVRPRWAGELLDRLEMDSPLATVVALIALISGLVIVALHPHWNGPLEIAVSVIGWAAVAEGALIVLLGRRFFTVVSPLAGGGAIRFAWGIASILAGILFLATAIYFR